MIDQTSEPTHSLSVDIGGTFTDFALLNLGSGQLLVHKLLTDPEHPANVFVQGASELLETAGIEFKQLQVVVHSTTLVTNAIIEREGSKTALITTKGFRDILVMGREQIYDLYDLKAPFPDPLVPRYLRREVSERTDRDGRILQPLDEAEALAVVNDLVQEGIEALAVSFLHSYKNSANEQAMKALVASRHPKLTVSISSQVAPIINEYERTSTTVADCYIKPLVSRYIQEIEDKLLEAGYTGRLLVMHSAGGVLNSDSAKDHPIRILESGPAAGALAGSFYGALLDQPDLISLDMGGTTAKTCAIENGKPAVTNNIEVARVHRFKEGSGLPILIPVLDLIEIGSGGGSIAWVDNLGLLKVGPQSAGAKPGPACYGMGGTDPTVTDANLVLGYLDPEHFLGGRMKLDTAAASKAISMLAKKLGMSEVQMAWGIYRTVTENMAAASRIHIISRNKDPRHYAIIAFGGAGPAHAHEVARILGVKQMIVPLAAGVTSAVGCLAAPLSFEDVRSMPGLLKHANWDRINNLYEEMEQQGLALVQEAGIPFHLVEFVRSADMRLVGQIHEINVPLPNGVLGPACQEGVVTDFYQIYQELYSRRNLNIPIEVQNWRLLVKGPQPWIRLRKEPVVKDANVQAALKGTRLAYFHTNMQYVDCPVYDRYELIPGTNILGPAIVEEHECTTVIGPADSANVDEWLNLIIKVG